MFLYQGNELLIRLALVFFQTDKIQQGQGIARFESEKFSEGFTGLVQLFFAHIGKAEIAEDFNVVGNFRIHLREHFDTIVIITREKNRLGQEQGSVEILWIDFQGDGRLTFGAGEVAGTQQQQCLERMVFCLARVAFNGLRRTVTGEFHLADVHLRQRLDEIGFRPARIIFCQSFQKIQGILVFAVLEQEFCLDQIGAPVLWVSGQDFVH